MSVVLEHVTKRYDGYPVVNDVSLEIADGELFVLLGPSGSGKSTILRMIAGLTGVETGRMLLHGRDLTRVPPRLRGIGFVFQQYALFQHMTVAENVEFGLRVRRIGAVERRRRREELLDLVGLAGLGDRRPRQLSGGQQQRVALARALAPRPTVLLLDEPFSALDAKLRVDMRKSLRQIHRELHVTAIFVTHDQEEAFELGDRLGVMNAGRLLEVGPPDELYLRPQTEFAATFLGSANLLLGEVNDHGIQVGPLHFALHTQTRQPEDVRRVQVLFRPEDVSLAPTREEVAGTPVALAEVEQAAFAGALERLRLRLPRPEGIRSIEPPASFGSDFLPVEAARSQDQALRFPLRAGDAVWVGIQRIHALVHPGLGLLLVTDGSPGAQAALCLGVQLARLAHARLTVLGLGLADRRLHECLQEVKGALASLPQFEARPTAETDMVATVRRETERQPQDLVVLSAAQPEPQQLVEQVLQRGDHHLLLVPPAGAPLPSKVLICVAGGEQSKEDVLFAGRLIRHIGARAALLSVISADGDEQVERARAERFLQASARVLAQLGIPARTSILAGRLRETIQMEMAKGGHDLLVLGAPQRPLGSSRIRHFLSDRVGYPVLVVRSPFSAPGATRPAAGDGRAVEEMIP